MLLLTTYGCKTTSSNVEKGKITSNGYWIPDKVEEIKGLKQEGPFIRLNDGSIFTVAVRGNKAYISKDEAKTWAAYPVFADTTHVLGSPVFIQTRSGVIVMVFRNDKERASWHWRKDIHDSPDATDPTYAIRSLDGGKTWQDLQKLHDAWTGAIRDIIKTDDGKVVVSTQMMKHHPGHHVTVTYTTKDDGKSWIRSNIIDLGGVGSHGGVFEATLTQLQDKRLWMLIRTNFGNFWQAFSSDDGLTWKDVGPSNIDASSSPGMLKRLQSGRLVLVWNRLFPKGKKEYPLVGGDSDLSVLPANWQRRELSIMFSDNDGDSWSKPVVIARAYKNKKKWISYPKIFEAKPGELWITTHQGGLNIELHEKDFVTKREGY